MNQTAPDLTKTDLVVYLPEIPSMTWKHLEQDSIPVGCVPSVCQLYMFRWPPIDVAGGGSVGPQMNMVEQVSSDDHQMSVARRG